MNIKAQLESVKLPQALAELKHANQFLKVFSISAAILSILSMTLVLGLMFRGPVVIAVAPSGEILSLDKAPKAEKEVEAALRRYIEYRYSWNSKDVSDQLKLARNFVDSNSLKSFDAELREIQKFSTDRNVSQSGYASTMSVDLAKQAVRVQGDRVTTIQGLTAAGPLSLTLHYASGPRTKANPWGIYVVREKNE